MSTRTLPYQPERFGRRFGPRASGSADYRPTVAGRTAPQPPAVRPWDELIGPVLFTHQVAERMQWTVDQVEAAQKDHALLGCRTRDGVWVFPAFQFHDVSLGELVHGFADVMRVFERAEVDPWAIAGWFVAPLRTLDGRSPIDVLRVSDREAIDTVRNAALDQSLAWQQ